MKYKVVFFLMLWLIALCYYILATRMAEITSIPPFDPFEQTGSVGPRWDRWKTRLQYYIDARGITVDNRKRALLLHLAGPAVQDIFATLSDTGTTMGDKTVETLCHFRVLKANFCSNLYNSTPSPLLNVEFPVSRICLFLVQH